MAEQIAIEQEYQAGFAAIDRRVHIGAKRRRVNPVPYDISQRCARQEDREKVDQAFKKTSELRNSSRKLAKESDNEVAMQDPGFAGLHALKIP